MFKNYLSSFKRNLIGIMEKIDKNILVIDDNEDVLLAAQMLLEQYFTVVDVEKDPNNIPPLLDIKNFDLILLDMNFTKDMTSGQEGFYWLDQILQIDPLMVVILITSFGDVNTAVKAIKFGATDFILKPWHNEKFIATISAALKLRESKQELSYLRLQNTILNQDIAKQFPDLIGNSKAMHNVFNLIQKVAKTDANILILGENGTGKELIARAIHRQSLRAEEAFISVDVGAIPHTLFESELFGHVRGAFTDAKEERIGRFELASKGTIFLDEISNIPIELQAKLLSVLQQRKVAKIGSNKFKEIDIRLISATNVDLLKLIDTGRFRDDLLYRINTVEIHVPPLRERKSDIELLVAHYLNIYQKKYSKANLRLTTDTLNKLKDYDWPGNVRELQHTVERAVILSDSEILKPEDFILRNSNQKSSGLPINSYNLDDIEKSVIQKVLAESNGNITKAAEELGLTRSSLYRRMEKYNL